MLVSSYSVLIMLRAIPTGWWMLKYELLDDDEAVGLVEFAFGGEGARITVGGEVYEVRCEGWFNREYFLATAGNSTIASAGNPVFSGRFVVNFNGRSYSLEKEPGLLNPNYILLDGAGVIGSIKPDGIFSRKCTIDIRGGFPRPIQAFVFWLVALLWNRSTDATAAST